MFPPLHLGEVFRASWTGLGLGLGLGRVRSCQGLGWTWSVRPGRPQNPVSSASHLVRPQPGTARGGPAAMGPALQICTPD